MTTAFEIRPYQGVGPLSFGSSPADAAASWGPADMDETGFLGERVEYRRANSLLVTYAQDGSGAVEFGFGQGVGELSFAGKPLFGEPPLAVLRHLVSHDPDPREYLGFVVFLSLGITLTGFHQPADDVSVTCFAKGRWDDVLAELKPARL